MQYKYEVYTCNNGNPTAIITNCTSKENKWNISEKIYDVMPEIDQAVVIIDENKDNCIFQLINGEFCGNACLSVCKYMGEKYGITDVKIINKVIDENEKEHYINIQGHCNNENCSLIIPKQTLINRISRTKSGLYKVEMNGITHIIIPGSFGNETIAYKEKDKLLKEEKMPDVLGIIFIKENRINPFIWIDRIELLQNQTACLSGSIAATSYINNLKSNNEEVDIIQPTRESYKIKIEENNINVAGVVRCIKTSEIEI